MLAREADSINPFPHFLAPMLKTVFPSFCVFLRSFCAILRGRFGRPNKVFYLRLGELACSEQKIPRCNFVPECLADLREPERRRRMERVNDIFKIHEHP